jgi:hypothetical protein
MHLASEVAWHRLLHYRPGFFSGFVSEVDGRAFFVSPRGKEDPEAELEATLAAFFAPVVRGQEDAHAMCRFPARLSWLNERLHFAERLPKATCPAFSRYAALVDPQAVSVVYSSSTLKDPVSSFGHLLLRLHTRPPPGAGGSDDKLDFAVDYKAEGDHGNPLLYVVKGLSGGFEGHYQFQSYESKVREYTDGEGRDIWEYDLALTPHEIELLSKHLWELAATYLDYFYLSENCSYNALTALEAAAPRLDLVSNVKTMVLPMDAVKALFVTPGLVRSVRERPAAGHAPKPDKAPERGHGTMRVTVGAGMTRGGAGYGTVGYRMALHDLADPADGYFELSQVQFLDTHLRFDFKPGPVTVEELTFAELMSLNPLNHLEKVLSWRVRTYGLRVRDAGCTGDCFAHGLDLAVGATLASRSDRVAVFVMADAYVLFSKDFDGIGHTFVRSGVGPYGGLRVRLPGQTIGLVTGTWSYLPGQTLGSTYNARGILRSALGKNVALGVEGSLQPASYDLQIASYLYF